jgi:hypothetical protein
MILSAYQYTIEAAQDDSSSYARLPHELLA